MDRSFEDEMLDLIVWKQRRERVIKALGQLTPVQRLSIILLMLGYTQGEIARYSSRHQQTISYHIRALKAAVGRV